MEWNEISLIPVSWNSFLQIRKKNEKKNTNTITFTEYSFEVVILSHIILFLVLHNVIPELNTYGSSECRTKM